MQGKMSKKKSFAKIDYMVQEGRWVAQSTKKDIVCHHFLQKKKVVFLIHTQKQHILQINVQGGIYLGGGLRDHCRQVIFISSSRC